MWKEGETFYVKPCQTNCEYYQYVLEESKRRGTLIKAQFGSRLGESPK
jgi:hypothetical protein